MYTSLQFMFLKQLQGALYMTLHTVKTRIKEQIGLRQITQKFDRKRTFGLKNEHCSSIKNKIVCHLD